jgi:hypothetical protein
MKASYARRASSRFSCDIARPVSRRPRVRARRLSESKCLRLARWCSGQGMSNWPTSPVGPPGACMTPLSSGSPERPRRSLTRSLGGRGRELRRRAFREPHLDLLRKFQVQSGTQAAACARGTGSRAPRSHADQLAYLGRNPRRVVNSPGSRSATPDQHGRFSVSIVAPEPGLTEGVL